MPRRTPDLKGKKFFRLLVIERAESYKRKKTNRAAVSRWLCVCDCGKTHFVSTAALIRGATRSCGCYQSESRIKHGMYNTRVYRIWHGVKMRCYLPSQTGYKYYGGRGIKMCDSWKESFDSFYKDMGDPPTDLHTIDRIENDGDYTRSNCRWATRTVQQNNRRKYVNWNQVLTEKDALEIGKSEEARIVLAQKYGVSVKYITQVRRNQRLIRLNETTR